MLLRVLIAILVFKTLFSVIDLIPTGCIEGKYKMGADGRPTSDRSFKFVVGSLEPHLQQRFQSNH
jgi:hypothetical protein